jgi:hypothetical protein
MYGRNVVSVIASLAPGTEVVLEPEDEIHRAIVVTHDGLVTNEAVRAALEPTATDSTSESLTARAS